MCLKNKKGKKTRRPPLKPRKGPYKKVNAYTMKPCKQQVITLFLAILLIILHSIFNIGAISQINHPILIIMMVIHFILIFFLIIIYVKITMRDPVDSIIVDDIKKANVALIVSGEQIRSSESDNRDQYKYCNLCRSQVHFKSYHCKRCNRCTQKFDHHCVYLNTCIGSKNYELFILIVMIFIVFLVNIIGQNIWIFVTYEQQKSQKNERLKPFIKTEWMMIAIIVLSAILLILSLVLCVFHFYMSCCLDITTLQFIQSEDTQSRAQDRKKQVKEGKKHRLKPRAETKKTISDSHYNNKEDEDDSAKNHILL